MGESIQIALNYANAAIRTLQGLDYSDLPENCAADLQAARAALLNTTLRLATAMEQLPHNKA